MNRRCPLVVLFHLATSMLQAQTAGSITNHSLPVSGFLSVIDAKGNTYFGGRTGSRHPRRAADRRGRRTRFINVFPVGSVPVTCSDAYVGKVDPEGNLLFGTFLGGPTADEDTALAVDPEVQRVHRRRYAWFLPDDRGRCHACQHLSQSLCGQTERRWQPLPLYSTYLPDTAATASAIAIDAQGDAYIAGATTASHAYVVKLSPSGSTILYYGTLAGSKSEAAEALLVDAAGNVVVTGYTTSPDFPVSPGVMQSRLAGATNLFIAKLDSAGKVALAPTSAEAAPISRPS